MRDPKRINEITQILNEVWQKYPDMRFWQLLACIPMHKVGCSGDLFYVEDNKDSLRFKRELMVSLIEESISLPEKDK